MINKVLKYKSINSIAKLIILHSYILYFLKSANKHNIYRSYNLYYSTIAIQYIYCI
jgi:hypothetical protein